MSQPPLPVRVSWTSDRLQSTETCTLQREADGWSLKGAVALPRAARASTTRGRATKLDQLTNLPYGNESAAGALLLWSLIHVPDGSVRVVSVSRRCS